MERGAVLTYLWRLSRPEVWLVTIIPMHVGWLLASREIVPGFARWTAFWARASQGGATSADFLATLAAWWGDARGWVLAAVAMGPLVWLATLCINDVHDLPTDRANPRKASSPLVQGVVSRGWAQGCAYLAAAAALVAGAFAGLAFDLLLLSCLVLAWLYSAPPVRLKTRPGADVLVNAVGVGALAALAGFSLAAPLSQAPWPFLPQGLLVAAAVYVPTTIVDLEPDLAAGYATFATALGRRRAYAVGFACWIAANLGAIALSAFDVILPRRMLPLLLVFAPLLVWEYHQFIGKARDAPTMIQGVILCSLTFAAVNALWALMWTGLWIG